MTRWEDFKDSILLAAGAIIGGVLLASIAVVKFFWPNVIK